MYVRKIRVTSDLFSSYSDQLKWFIDNEDVIDFLGVLRQTLIAMYSRSGINAKLLPKSNVRDFNCALVELCKVVNDALDYHMDTRDIVLEVNDKGTHIELLVGRPETSYRLDEFKFFLDKKRKEGEFVSKEIYDLIDEFKTSSVWGVSYE